MTENPKLAVIGDSEAADWLRSRCAESGVDLVAAQDAAVVAVCTRGEAVTPTVAALADPATGFGLHVVRGFSGQVLIEIVAADQTAPATVGTATALAATLGLEAVVTRDRPGFLVERLVLPYLNQAIQALDDGIATAADIDRSVELGLGYPTGPLRLLDRIGLDRHLHATCTVAAELADPHFVPPPLLTRRVQAGAGSFSNQETPS